MTKIASAKHAKHQTASRAGAKEMAPDGDGGIGMLLKPADRSAERLPSAGLIAFAALALAFAITYASSGRNLIDRWWNDPDYLHGFLVPIFAGYLLWYRRSMLRDIAMKGSAWGLVLIGMAGVMRWISAYNYMELVDNASIIPCIAGLVLFVCGWNVLRWATPSIAFLVFMIPLPGFVATLLSHPLQRIATIASTYVVQTVGVPAVAEGNIISLGDTQIGVAEACNGLRNMMLFIAVASAVAFMIKRPWFEKIIIIASAAPIAVIANVVRITATAVLHALSHPKLADTTYHDLAAWFMMPLAVVMLWIELAILKRIFVVSADPDRSGA